MMQFPEATFTEITDFGIPVPPEGGSHLGWDKAPVEELEQRFLKHGTVVITKDCRGACISRAFPGSGL